MAPFGKLLLSTLVVADSFCNAASAFTTTPSPLVNPQSTKSTVGALEKHSVRSNNKKNSIMTTPTHTVRLRGGGSDAAAKNKRVRIQAFDSMRFFLIVNIVCGHFISFANPSETVLKFASHHNAAVGAFFALSGYVLTYTSTEIAQRAASPKLTDTPKQKWILSKIFGYYPLHLAVLILFSPVFLYADVHYNGWLVAAVHGLMSATMTQAWFPLHAEVWNAPTWYLSALAFCTMCMPYALPALATCGKSQLKKTGAWLFLAYLLPKLGYIYDFNAWTLFEGITSPKAHPNIAIFNMIRFSPIMNVAEFLLGAVACRLVMLDNASDEEDAPKTTGMSTLVPLAAILASQYARAIGLLNCSDMIYRSLIFVPLFLKFLMAAHRNTVGNVKDGLVKFLSSKTLVTLGNLTFPIFIAHGPVGQIFYKKIIAKQLFGGALRGPANFGLYLATTTLVAFVLQKTILQNKAVGNWSKKTVDQLSSWM